MTAKVAELTSKRLHAQSGHSHGSVCLWTPRAESLLLEQVGGSSDGLYYTVMRVIRTSELKWTDRDIAYEIGCQVLILDREMG